MYFIAVLQVSMGFTRDQATRALRENNNNVQMAATSLLN